VTGCSVRQTMTHHVIVKYVLVVGIVWHVVDDNSDYMYIILVLRVIREMHCD